MHTFSPFQGGIHRDPVKGQNTALFALFPARTLLNSVNCHRLLCVTALLGWSWWSGGQMEFNVHGVNGKLNA